MINCATRSLLRNELRFSAVMTVECSNFWCIISSAKRNINIAWIVVIISEVPSVVEWWVVIVPEHFKKSKHAELYYLSATILFWKVALDGTHLSSHFFSNEFAKTFHSFHYIGINPVLQNPSVMRFDRKCKQMSAPWPSIFND